MQFWGTLVEPLVYCFGNVLGALGTIVTVFRKTKARHNCVLLCAPPLLSFFTICGCFWPLFGLPRELMDDLEGTQKVSWQAYTRHFSIAILAPSARLNEVCFVHSELCDRMPKFYCAYCDLYLTHSGLSGLAASSSFLRKSNHVFVNPTMYSNYIL